MYLGGKNRKGAEERGKEIGACGCRGISREEFWCRLLPARSPREGATSAMAEMCLGGDDRRCVELAMVAVLARESELGRTASECSQRFFLSEVNGKFTEMIEISNGSTSNAIFLKLNLLMVFF